jgi:hypothetical protein
LEGDGVLLAIKNDFIADETPALSTDGKTK